MAVHRPFYISIATLSVRPMIKEPVNVFFFYVDINDDSIPCEFCRESFPVDDIAIHQVSNQTLHVSCFVHVHKKKLPSLEIFSKFSQKKVQVSFNKFRI